MTPPRARLLAALAALALGGGLLRPAATPAQETEPDAPFVPTPMNVVVEMLDVAGVAAEDTVYDLGSGDGRLPITAARVHGARGVGVELDSGLVAESRGNARRAEVDGRVRFVRGDLFETDLEPATVVTLYLFPEVNERLRPRLLRQLEPGDRVVAHDFSMGAWTADSTRRVSAAATARESLPVWDEGQAPGAGSDGKVDAAPEVDDLDARLDSLAIGAPRPVPGPSTVYMWVIPARVQGVWRVRLPGGGTERIRVDQRFQELRVARRGEPFGDEPSGRLEGRRLQLTLETSDGRALRLEGTVSGGGIEGRTADGEPWSARRMEETGGSIESWEG